MVGKIKIGSVSINGKPVISLLSLLDKNHYWAQVTCNIQVISPQMIDSIFQPLYQTNIHEEKLYITSMEAWWCYEDATVEVTNGWMATDSNLWQIVQSSEVRDNKCIGTVLLYGTKCGWAEIWTQWKEDLESRGVAVVVEEFTMHRTATL